MEDTSKNVDFGYFISLSVKQQLPWESLAVILEDLTPTLEQCKKVMKVLLKELQNSHTIPDENQIDTFENDQETENYEKEDENQPTSSESHSGNSHVQEDDATLDKINLEFEDDNFGIEVPEETENVSKFKIGHLKSDAIDLSIFDKKENSFYTFIGDVSEERIETEDSDKKADFEIKSCSSDTKAAKTNLNDLDTCQTCNGKCSCNEFEENRSKVVKKEKLFNCAICEKAFERKRAMKNHEKIHINSKSYHCDICGNSYNTNDHLTEHKKSHINQELKKNFECNVCGKIWATAQLLKVHMNIHTNEDKIKCTICEKIIKKASWKRHKIIHDEDRPFKCNICPKTSKTQKRT